MIRSLWTYRKYIVNNAFGELKFKYSGSTLGVIWNVVNPLAQIIVYSVVFSRIIAMKLPNMNYSLSFTIYLCSGLLPWIAFSECIFRGVTAFNENAPFLKKLPIPEIVFTAQISVSSFLSGLISLFLLFIMTVITGGTISLFWVNVPIVLSMMTFFGFGVSLILGTLNVFIKDIAQLISILMQLWMWLTPIVYMEDIVPAGFKKFLSINPIYPYIDAFHKVIVYNEGIGIKQWAQMLGYASIVTVVGYLVLMLLRKEIRDLI